MQKFQSSYSMKNELKIFLFKKICHVALNENESETVNDLFINNDSNNSNSDDFVLIMSFMHSVLLITVFNITVCQNEKQFKDFKKKCQSADHYFINNKIFNSVYN